MHTHRVMVKIRDVKVRLPGFKREPCVHHRWILVWNLCATVFNVWVVISPKCTLLYLTDPRREGWGKITHISHGFVSLLLLRSWPPLQSVGLSLKTELWCGGWPGPFVGVTTFRILTIMCGYLMQVNLYPVGSPIYRGPSHSISSFWASSFAASDLASCCKIESTWLARGGWHRLLFVRVLSLSM